MLLSCGEKMRLTIGMAHFEDFDGAVFSIQSLALHHNLADVEIIVVDNSPTTAAGRALESHITAWKSRGRGVQVRYVPMTENGGTTQTRERIFAEATGDAVLVMDCHVLLAPGSLDRLVAYYEQNPDCRDLLQGPMLYNDLRQVSTHFDDVWRGEMWGTWGTDKRGLDPEAEPFDIFAQGLGLFTCRKDAWLGFNPNFRGFGGEECYIHTKFRQAGRRTLCLPFLRWWHRFERPAGVRYPLTRFDKVRNYVLGHQELGLPLDRVHEHFVASGLFPQSDWDRLVADPVNSGEANCPSKKCGGAASRVQPQTAATIDDLFAWVVKTPRDLDQHAMKIKEFAAKCDSVAAFVKRREWNVILAAARPRDLVVYQTEQDPLLDVVHQATKNEATDQKEVRRYTTIVGPDADSLKAEPLKQADMLVIDTVHHGERLRQELERHGAGVKRFIVLRGTAVAGEQSEDRSGPGLLPAMRAFVAANSEWSVIWHSQEQYGLTVLGRDKRDKPTLPSMFTMAQNLARAVSEHVMDNLTKTSHEELEARLKECSLCPQRTNDRCSVCGCFLAKKASFRSSDCPLGKWPKIEKTDEAAS